MHHNYICSLIVQSGTPRRRALRQGPGVANWARSEFTLNRSERQPGDSILKSSDGSGSISRPPGPPQHQRQPPQPLAASVWPLSHAASRGSILNADPPLHQLCRQRSGVLTPSLPPSLSPFPSQAVARCLCCACVLIHVPGRCRLGRAMPLG
jgi:hypothetical protein